MKVKSESSNKKIEKSIIKELAKLKEVFKLIEENAKSDTVMWQQKTQMFKAITKSLTANLEAITDPTIIVDSESKHEEESQTSKPSSLEQPTCNLEDVKVEPSMNEKKFYEEENRRAEEKHKEEIRRAEEKHQEELTEIRLRNELLQIKLNRERNQIDPSTML